MTAYEMRISDWSSDVCSSDLTLMGAGGSGSATGSQINKQASAGVQLNIPFYQGGRPAAQVRRNQALEPQALEREIEVERGVIAQTRSACARWQASLDIIPSTQPAVEAEPMSLKGVRAS